MPGIAFEAEIIEWRGPAPFLFAVTLRVGRSRRADR